MVKIIFGCLVLALGLWGCDDSDCLLCPIKCQVDVGQDPGFLSDFAECPTDGLKQICNSYRCTQDDEFIAAFKAKQCKPQDCFNMSCAKAGRDGSKFSATVEVDEVFDDSSFTGILGTGESVFTDVTCVPLGFGAP
jgi:hypothetical protein